MLLFLAFFLKSSILRTRGGAVVAREAHKILWRRVVTFCGKFSKLLGSRQSSLSVISSQALNQKVRFREGSETIMGTTLFR